MLDITKDMKFGKKHDVGPGEALLLLVQHKSAEVEYWREKVIALDEIVGWRDVEVTQKDGQGTFGATSEETVKRQEVIHPWYKLLRDAERDLATYSVSALRAGVEERLVRASEQVGSQMLGVLNEFARAVGLNPAQQAIAATAIPALLRALPAPSRAPQV